MRCVEHAHLPVLTLGQPTVAEKSAKLQDFAFWKLGRGITVPNINIITQWVSFCFNPSINFHLSELTTLSKIHSNQCMYKLQPPTICKCISHSQIIIVQVICTQLSQNNFIHLLDEVEQNDLSFTVSIQKQVMKKSWADKWFSNCTVMLNKVFAPDQYLQLFVGKLTKQNSGR